MGGTSRAALSTTSDEAGKYHIGDEITLHLSAGDETFVVFAKYVNRGFGRLHFYPNISTRSLITCLAVCLCVWAKKAFSKVSLSEHWPST